MSGAVRKKRKKFSYVDVLKDLFPWKGDDALEVIRKLVFLTAIIVLGVCAYLIFDYFWDNYQARQEYDRLSGIYELAMQDNSNGDDEPITTQQTAVTEINDEGGIDIIKPMTILPGAEALIQANPDTVGYIYIEGTNINYPIVQKKDPNIGNEYYLTRSFMGEEFKAGAIFMDYRNRFDDIDNSDNIIVYGHNMKDNSMFGQLKYYKNNPDYYSQHPIIHLSSNYNNYKYKIFGYFITNALEKDGQMFEYYNYLNFDSEEKFYEFANGVKKRSMGLNDVDVKYGDQILTLSTCGSEFDESRFVVVARKIREGEDELEGAQNSSVNPNPLMPDAYYKWRGGGYDPNAPFTPYG